MRLLSSKTMAAILVIAVVIAGAIAWRHVRQQQHAAQAPAGQSPSLGEAAPASAPPVPATAGAGEASAGEAGAPKSEPVPASTAAAESPRRLQMTLPPPPEVRPEAPSQQVATTAEPPPILRDTRPLAQPLESGATNVPPPRETGETVTIKPAQPPTSTLTGAVGSLLRGLESARTGLQDSRELVAERAQPRAGPVERPATQAPMGRVASAPAPPPVPQRTPPIPSFNDPRELVQRPPGQVPQADTAQRAGVAAVVERRETVQRTPQGLVVERREGPATVPAAALPSFLDQRQLPATAPAETVASPRVAAAAVAPAAPAPAAALSPRASPAPAGRPCEPAQIASEPLDGGRMLLRVGSPCRAEQVVRLAYGDATQARRLDNEGRLEVTIDLYAGTSSPIEVVFEDGTSREVTARANDLDRVEKIALIWRAPVNLDLHAMEYGAALGQPGHVWAQAPSSAIAAREFTLVNRRGRGFMSRADEGQGGGDKIEVYTFFHHPDQRAGAVALAIDYATRGDVPSGDTCIGGAQGEIRFQIVSAARGRVQREAGILAPASCGVRLAPDARYAVVHQIRINR